MANTPAVTSKTFTRQCGACATEFTFTASGRGRFNQRTYCSKQCKLDAVSRRKKAATGGVEIQRQCSGCGADFTIVRGWGGSNTTRKYCTPQCKDKAILARIRERRKAVNKEYDPEARQKAWLATKANPESLAKHRASTNKYRAETRNFLAEYKMERGCVDCGYKEHPAALQLDHEGYKSVSIAEARSSKTRLLAEIEAGKCVVRCANCHAVVTWKRKVGLA